MNMKVNKRGQVTIPKQLREKKGLHPDVEVEVVQSYIGVVFRQPLNRWWEDKSDANAQTRETLRVNGKGQVTIPKHLRDEYGLHPDVEVDVMPTHKGVTVRKIPEEALEVRRRLEERKHLKGAARVAGILGKEPFGKGVTVDQFIDEIRGR